MVRKIHWGILGTGAIATKFTTALKFLDDCLPAAVASRSLERAEKFAKEFHIEKAYGSYEALIKDPDIDVVYIALPHTEHKNMTKLCLENKKAVLCEKPLTINAADTEELIEIAGKNRTFLMEAMWTKFLPATKKVREWIDGGRIGKVLHIRADFGYYKEFDINSRVWDPNLGGGALLDVGIYPITYATYLLNRLPDRIISSAITGKSQVDEQNVIIFRYKDGVLADLSSAISAEIGREAFIAGEKGYIKVDNFFMADSAYLYDNNHCRIDMFKEPFKANGYEYEAAEVNRCLREGLYESPVNPLKSTLDIMKLMDEIRSQWGLVYPQERQNSQFRHR